VAVLIEGYIAVFLLGLLLGVLVGATITWLLDQRQLSAARREVELATWRVAQTTALVKIAKAELPPTLRRVK
jgi:phosphotransferase system  glucose/maltose/N-acetylglucosamine-specific IIC component